MGEITLKLEVPTGLEDKVGFAVERVISEFLEEIQFSIARDILKESELTEEQAKELGKEVSAAVAKRHLWFKKIEPVPKEEYSGFLEEAKKFSPLEDFPYTALALKYKSSGMDVRIWSNDPEFREKVENKIPVVYSTPELKEELELGLVWSTIVP